MAKAKNSQRRRSKPGEIPQMLYHKGKNLAYILIDGKPRYCGKPRTPEAEDRRLQLWNEYLSRSAVTCGPKEPISVITLVARFMKHAKVYYQKNGRSTGSAERFGVVARPLVSLYGETEVEHFGPIALKAIRRYLIDEGECRTTINKKIGFIRQIFKWGEENEMVSPNTVHALQSVAGLKKGRTEAPERPPVRPVKDSVIAATLPHLGPTVRDMVRLQRLTGMRPGEVCNLRFCDIYRGSDEFPEGMEFLSLEGCWVYIPGEHKTEHHDKARWLVFGPKSIEILMPYLKDQESGEYVFSPERENRRRLEEMRAGRKSKVQPSQKDRSKPGAKRKPGEKYLESSYYHAIKSAIEKANKREMALAEQEGREPVLLLKWFPNQLRHTKGTEVRSNDGPETAQVVLGHSNIRTTEIYAEKDKSKAVEHALKWS